MYLNVSYFGLNESHVKIVILLYTFIMNNRLALMNSFIIFEPSSYLNKLFK